MSMADPLQYQAEQTFAPDLSHLITEDDTGVDNRYTERQQKLLSVPLFESWEEGKPFEALVDVGVFYRPNNSDVIVPDFLLSLEVSPRELTSAAEDRCYCTWIYGKPPNLVVEIVSQTPGGELGRKLEIYQRIGVAYYAVFDPLALLGRRTLRLFQLVGGRYVELADPCQLMPEIGLGFTLWEGEYLDTTARWLRFANKDGILIPTGAERAHQAEERAEQAENEADRAKNEADRARNEAERAKNEAERAKVRAEQSERRAEELARRLRDLGIEP